MLKRFFQWIRRGFKPLPSLPDMGGFESYNHLQQYLEHLSAQHGAAELCKKCGIEGKDAVFPFLGKKEMNCCQKNYGYCFCMVSKKKLLGCSYYLCKQMKELFPELADYFSYIRKNKRKLGELKTITDYNKK